MATLPQNLQAAVDQVLRDRPTKWKDRFRAAKKPVAEWFANVAYWIAFPDKPMTIEPGDEAGADAWLEMHAAISFALVATDVQPAKDPALPRWPLGKPPISWGSGAAFGAKRPASKKKAQTRKHTGVDIDADRGVPVLAMESGVVVAVDVGWEAPTVAIVLAIDSGKTLLLGGLRRGMLVSAGDRFVQGQPLAVIEAYPLGDTMLHVQLYEGIHTLAWVRQRMSWPVNSPQPDGLLDPTEYLQAAAWNTPNAASDVMVGAFGDSPVDPLYESSEDTEGEPPADAGAPGSTPMPPATEPSGSAGLVVAGAAALLVAGGIYSLVREPPAPRRAR